MIKTTWLWVVLAFFYLPCFGAGLSLDRSEVSFVYQLLTDPFESVPCEWDSSLENPYDRKVHCELRGVRHEFVVHLALSFYPHTSDGVSAYELLYWVTDFTDPKAPVNDSQTLWIHNSESSNRATLLESSLGVENDNAYLRLKIRLAKKQPR